MDNSLEEVYRRDWPLIVGAVARYTSDLALAEDCVQEAFLRALTSGTVLRNPSAWITTTARRIAVDSLRRGQTLQRVLPNLARDAVTDTVGTSREEFMFSGDERLLMMGLLAHPELSEEDRVALALRFVCGATTRAITGVFLVPEATMAARLTRAKKKLAVLDVHADVVTAEQFLPRIDTLLTTVYLLYTVGHAVPPGTELTAGATRSTAISLGRELAALLPDHLETNGLLALMLLTEARQFPGADDGAPVTLADADRPAWNQDLIAEGLRLATVALPGGGRFALQAGISGLHCAAPSWEATDWPAIARLYDRLVEVWPAPSVALNRTIARGLSNDVGPDIALAELAALFPKPGHALEGQAWAARAELLCRLGRFPEAARAYRHALDSVLGASDRAYLQGRWLSLTRPGGRA